MKCALNEWPIEQIETVCFGDKPDISFVIPHRGKARLDLLAATIRSIAASKDVSVECLVVEQSSVLELEGLPGNCRVIHAPSLLDRDPWHKTLAYNVGVEHARGEIVICHDGDVLVPRDYARQVGLLFEDKSLEVVFCQRFLFYLTQHATMSLLQRGASVVEPCELDEIRQNWVGGTLAIRKSKYWAIGGFDEEFVGWTGEDTEFHDRCQALNGWFWGFVPFVHLWHPPQPEKYGIERQGQVDFTKKKLAEPRSNRICKLIEKRNRTDG